VAYFEARCMLCGGRYPKLTIRERARRDAPLEVRIALDIDALLDGADLDTAPPELPEATPDLTRYVDAYAQAVKTCPHHDVESVLHEREYSCNDCGAYLTWRQLRQARNRY
jgi:hypothetical protein